MGQALAQMPQEMHLEVGSATMTFFKPLVWILLHISLDLWLFSVCAIVL